MMPNTLPPWDTSDAIVCRKPVQPVAVCSPWPCESCPSTNVTWTSLQSMLDSSASVLVVWGWVFVAWCVGGLGCGLGGGWGSGRCGFGDRRIFIVLLFVFFF